MTKIKKHLTCNIDYLLKMSDNKLKTMFQNDGKEVRKDLEERKAKGEILIGSEGCEGFDPIDGCPGHKID